MGCDPIVLEYTAGFMANAVQLRQLSHTNIRFEAHRDAQKRGLIYPKVTTNVDVHENLV